MLANGWTVWVSDSVPAGITNDLGLLKQNIDSFNECFEEADGVVCDGIYNALQEINSTTNQKWTRCELITKNCAVRGRPLTNEEIIENEIIEEARGKI
jgi:UDP-N-acetylmuramate-alanine ligase